MEDCAEVKIDCLSPGRTDGFKVENPLSWELKSREIVCVTDMMFPTRFAGGPFEPPTAPAAPRTYTLRTE